MQDLLRGLLDRLDCIAVQHDEVGDTDVREAMSLAVFHGFLRPVPGFALSDNFQMFSDEGNRLVKQALGEFIPLANKLAAEFGLSSFHARLSAFQDGTVQSLNGNYYDDYFGWADPDDYDAMGNVLRRE